MASPPNGYPDPRHEGLAANRNGTGSPGEHTAPGGELGQQRPPRSPNVWPEPIAPEHNMVDAIRVRIESEREGRRGHH